VTRKWGEVQNVLRVLEAEDCKETDVLPDQIPNTKDIIQSERFGRSILRRDGSGGPCIGNDLHNLPDVLRQNLYACIRSLFDADDEPVPVESSIVDLKHRISLIRLRHQADKLGLLWNPSIPWAFQARKQYAAETESPEEKMEGSTFIHPADLVPENPSDWIPYDPDTHAAPWDFRDYFNTKDYGDFYRQRYSNSEDTTAHVGDGEAVDIPWITKEGKTNAEDAKEPQPPSEDGIMSTNDSKEDLSADEMASTSKFISSSPEEEDDSVFNILYETILLLKDGGNAALQAGEFNTAARRYDEAIQYGAVAFMSFPIRDLDFAKGRREKLKETGRFHLEWGPLLRVLVVTRLNMALLMLKPQFSHPNQAAEQARLALHELKPFCQAKGKIMKGSKLDFVHRTDEPEETYQEAMALQAKGYFRLGSAQYEQGEYSDAIHSFEHSVKSTQLSNAKPDTLVLRRLSEAKRENRRQSKRHRKKFKLAFGVTEPQRKKSSQKDATEES
jgi:tetratricopeptide (TPR) repeat protein